MRSPFWLLALLLSGLLVAPAAAQAGGTGALTLIVRDLAGHPLAGVTLQLAYDGDLALDALGTFTATRSLCAAGRRCRALAPAVPAAGPD